MADAHDLRPGDRVRVRAGIDVPEWATTGNVVNPHNRPSAGDNYLHPSVLWEDGKRRIVPDSWLEVMSDLDTAHADVLAALDRYNAELVRELEARGGRMPRPVTPLTDPTDVPRSPQGYRVRPDAGEDS